MVSAASEPWHVRRAMERLCVDVSLGVPVNTQESTKSGPHLVLGAVQTEDTTGLPAFRAWWMEEPRDGYRQLEQESCKWP